MIKRAVSICALALLLCACSGVPPQNSSVSVAGSPGLEPPGLIPAEDKAAQGYPEQAAEYLRMGLEGSALVYFNQGDARGELILPGANYSDAVMSPDGSHVLCKSNAGGAGEARWCGYYVVSLITKPTEFYAYGGEQWGFQDHVWLDSDIIGFASGGVIGGQEDTWESIRLFDRQYNPLDVELQFFTDNPGIAGIGYDSLNKKYIVSHAESMPAADTLFSLNRLMLSVFDEKGELDMEIGIPEEYQSPYSPNIQVLLPNNPMVTAEGHILIAAQKRSDIETGNYNSRVLLVLSPEDLSIQELPLGYSPRLSAGGESAFDIGYSDDGSGIQPAYLYLKGRKDAAVQGLPGHFTVDGYSGKFVPFDAAMRDRHVYIMAENYTDEGELYCGLFYWDADADKNAGDIRLLQILPGRGDCNLAGVDGEGFCYVLINGIVPENADGDVQEQLKDKRERVLALIS